MTSRIFACAALLFTAVFSGCAGAPGAAAEQAQTVARGPRSGPALWVLRDADTTIYLFGTIHLLPDGVRWMTPAIQRAFDASDTLVLETLGTMEPGNVAPVVQELGYSPGEPPLADRVKPAERGELAAAIEDAGVPAAALDPMETWLATMTLSTARIVRLGYGLDSGVESDLAGRAKAAGKTMLGLETVRQQLSFFDTLPEDAQRIMLVESLDDRAEIERTVNATVDDWRKGDVDAVAAVLEDDVRGSPLLAKRLLADRNANWATWIAARMMTPGTVFVAVGTGHLAGDKSVQTMLKAKGLRVERVN